MFQLFSFSGCLALLWFRLIDHLRIEWSVNPQYSYGWAVPVLCLYLVWENIKRNAHTPKTETLKKEIAGTIKPASPLFSFSAFQHFSVFLLALAYAPIRLIQEANPEWRLVSWALALDVIAITLLLLRPWSGVRGPWSLAFPLCFFLVAVPWPTLVERPLIQTLTHANAATTAEVLGLLGVPAIQHGSVIEVGAGLVGIDDACSGIRSFQATLMISLFFGELYRLTARRRVLCVLAGFGLSFIFNVARTGLLTWVAARQGIRAVAHWHDPAGVTILVACFLALWLVSRALGRSAKQKAESRNLPLASSGGQAREEEASIYHSTKVPWSRGLLVSWSLLLWLVAVEVGTEWWYRSHEAHLPLPITWTVALPRDNPTFQEVPLAENTRQLLRYDEAQSAAWQEDPECRLQAFFFRWKPGRIAVHLAKTHTPASCLSASGHDIIAQSELRPFSVKGLQLPFRSYVFKQAEVPVHVYYCLWEDRAAGQSFGAASLTYQNRLVPVLAGRRNSGQRSLELAIWGIADDQDADLEFQRQLDHLVRLQRTAEFTPLQSP